MLYDPVKIITNGNRIFSAVLSPRSFLIPIKGPVLTVGGRWLRGAVNLPSEDAPSILKTLLGPNLPFRGRVYESKLHS